MIPYKHVTRDHPGYGTMPLSTGVIHYDLHGLQTPWPQQVFNPGDQTRAPRHRYLKAVDIVDEEKREQRTVKSGMNNLQVQFKSESEHRK